MVLTVFSISSAAPRSWTNSAFASSMLVIRAFRSSSMYDPPWSSFHTPIPGQGEPMLKITEQAQEAIASIVADGEVGDAGGLRITGSGSNGETALDFDLA